MPAVDYLSAMPEVDPERIGAIGHSAGGLLAVPGLRRWGDLDDVLAGLYPRPFLETSGDISRADVHRKAAAAYAAAGVAEHTAHVFYDAKAHVFRKDMRELSYEWLDRWLGQASATAGAED